MSRTAPGTPEVVYDDGVHLVDSVLWFDSPRERDLCFVSHARTGRFPPHRKVLCTQATARLAAGRLAQADLLVSPYSHAFTLGGLSIELFPSGHMLGAASIQVRRQGRTVVYAGDVNLPGSRTAERAQVRPCDVLVVGCPYGDPDLALPPPAEAEAALLRWVSRALEEGVTPVILADRLGKAQDVLHLLAEAGVPVRAHRSIHEATAVYGEFGRAFPGVRRFRGTPSRDEALVWPILLRSSPSIGRMRRPLRMAVCTGRAVFEAAELKRRHRVQEAFPLSCHSGYEALREYIRATNPDRVLLHRGRVQACAEALRRDGVDARPLTGPEQLSLV